jgi:hypothetical protein
MQRSYGGARGCYHKPLPFRLWQMRYVRYLRYFQKVQVQEPGRAYVCGGPGFLHVPIGALSFVAMFSLAVFLTQTLPSPLGKSE